ncbi:hypothetical protein AB205_0162700, partial [Aquarana catesbeiana]
GGLINFEKRRKEYEVLAKIQKLQLTCRHYVLTPKPEILQAFYMHRQLTEDQSYRISRTIEPPADSCPNSPRIRRKLTKRFSSLLLGSEVFSPKMNGDRVSPSGSCSSCEIDEGLIAALCPAETAINKDRGSTQEVLTPPSTPGREEALRSVSSPRSPVSPSLPVYNQQIADLCIIRVSMENTHGNLYKSILLTSQDKSRVVIQRALHKHNIESYGPDDFQLVQLLSEGKELTIPDTANVYYAMNTSANFDFVLRRRPHCAHQTQLLCPSIANHCAHQMQPLCPSNAATVPIKCSHCAHQTQPLCPYIATTVSINCSHCAHQTQPLCPSNPATVPINCHHYAHQAQPLCPSNAATVPIICHHCAIKHSHCNHQLPPLCPINCRQFASSIAASVSHQLPPVCPIKCCQCPPTRHLPVSGQRIPPRCDRHPITAPVASANQVTGNQTRCT